MKYQLIRSDRKTISIKIDKELNVIVRAPNKLNKSYIDKFVLDNTQWIEKNLEKMQNQAKLYEPKKYTTGESFYIFGNEYHLRIVDDSKKILISDDEILFPYEFLNYPEEYMKKFYQKLAKDYIITRAKEIAAQIGINPKRYSITSADKRWGSYSSKGNVNFSYKLVMADKYAIDYVIIHEFCHSKHMNHSKEYWALVEQIMPDYKKYKKYFKDNGHKFRVK